MQNFLEWRFLSLNMGFSEEKPQKVGRTIETGGGRPLRTKYIFSARVGGGKGS